MKKSLALASLVLLLSSSQLMHGSQKKKKSEEKGLLETVMDFGVKHPKVVIAVDTAREFFCGQTVLSQFVDEKTLSNLFLRLIEVPFLVLRVRSRLKEDDSTKHLLGLHKEKKEERGVRGIKEVCKDMSLWDGLDLGLQTVVCAYGANKVLRKNSKNKMVIGCGTTMAGLGALFTQLFAYERGFAIGRVYDRLNDRDRCKKISGALDEGVSLESLVKDLDKTKEALDGLLVKRGEDAIAREEQHEKEIAKKDEEIAGLNERIVNLLRRKKK